MMISNKRYLSASLFALGAGSILLSTAVAAQQPAPPASGPLQFREQEVAKDFGVGYAVVPGDVNGDKRTDILAISGTELVWFQAPNWEKNVILAAGATTADNVTLAPHDIDGDGRLDVALGAGWTAPEHRYPAVGQTERTRHNSRLGGVSDFRRADPASDQVGRRRRRQEARADRRAAARQRRQGTGLGWTECPSAGVQAAGETADRTRGRWKLPARPTTFSTISWR